MPVRQLSNASSADESQQDQRYDDVDRAGAGDRRRLIACGRFLDLFNGHPGLRSQDRARDEPWPVRHATLHYFATKPASCIRPALSLSSSSRNFTMSLPVMNVRLERLLLHVLFVFGGLRHFLEQVDVERLLLASILLRQEERPQHRVLHVEPFLLAGRDIVPGLRAGDLALVFDALSVEHAQRAYLTGAPHFKIFRRIIDIRLRVVADELRRRLAAGLVGQIENFAPVFFSMKTVRIWSSRLEPVPPILNGGLAFFAASTNSFTDFSGIVVLSHSTNWSKAVTATGVSSRQLNGILAEAAACR